MALKKTVIVDVSGQSVTFPDAYIRVNHVGASKYMANAQIEILTEPNGGIIKHGNVSFVPTMESNFIAQAYNKLKTLPEYQNAIDC